MLEALVASALLMGMTVATVGVVNSNLESYQSISQVTDMQRDTRGGFGFMMEDIARAGEGLDRRRHCHQPDRGVAEARVR